MLVRAHHTADAESAQVLTPPEAAAFLKISERTLWTLTKAGTLPAVRVGAQWRYSRRALCEYIEAATSVA